MTTNIMIPAAQYLRMSTEDQPNSIPTQRDGIQRYAAAHGFEVVATYSDPGKSGLEIRNRPGLRRLLRDVLTGNCKFRAILVYDVSRWGRFQDTDESAHYEFICRRAGIPVRYCAEQFENDTRLPNAIMKTLKRSRLISFSISMMEVYSVPWAPDTRARTGPRFSPLMTMTGTLVAASTPAGTSK